MDDRALSNWQGSRNRVAHQGQGQAAKEIRRPIVGSKKNRRRKLSPAPVTDYDLPLAGSVPKLHRARPAIRLDNGHTCPFPGGPCTNVTTLWPLWMPPVEGYSSWDPAWPQASGRLDVGEILRAAATIGSLTSMVPSFLVCAVSALSQTRANTAYRPAFRPSPAVGPAFRRIALIIPYEEGLCCTPSPRLAYAGGSGGGGQGFFQRHTD